MVFLCIIQVRSLFCSVWVYISRHFLPILGVKLGFGVRASVSLAFNF